MIKFTIKKEDLHRWREVVHELLRDCIMKEKGIELDINTLEFEFEELSCGCTPPKININELPLETISCDCGKNKIVEFEFV